MYLECYSGISGDMTVAALLDLGADEVVLRSALDSLNIGGYKIKIGRTQKCGIDACDFDVILDNLHDHDHFHHHKEDHNHDFDDQGHNHQQDHNLHKHDNSHGHRNVNDIYKIIDESNISNRSKIISRKIFDIIAKAEAKAHGVDIENVHFHEVGAIDSIVDIVAVAVCIDDLDISDVIISDLYEGSGHVKCQHGIIPVPVPAVVNILSDNSLSIKMTEENGEMITPTGAAIAAALRTQDYLPSKYKIQKIGYGAGKKDFEKANILRALLIENTDKKNNLYDIWILETNLDDCTGENLGYVMEKLLELGAKDVFYTPIYMKKNRPAYKLSVLCRIEDIKLLESLIFRNTTSIGIRRYKAERMELDREILKIETKYGKVRFKVAYFEKDKYCYPEYEDIKKICNERNLSYKVVYEEIIRKFNN